MNFQSLQKNGKRQLMVIGGLLLIMIGLTAFQASGLFGVEAAEKAKATTTGLTIKKNEISGKAKFYPVNVDGVKMEVIAVKASDGTVRTAFNTCQVCFDSGRGYYTQQGNELVCFNCSNRFKIDQIEKVRFGCNPIPIFKENKSEDAKTIEISQEFLRNNKQYFGNWKR
ncbi:MAG TPA: DUF2318 domain-containing protein [Bacillota bacterium]|nr:DUF2318 domain-containing protein [Bacillota bacterium]